jgi:hypothetical protein
MNKDSMLKEWIEIGGMLVESKEKLEECLFLPDGTQTPLYTAFFRQLGKSKNLEHIINSIKKKIKKGKKCVICQKEGAAPLTKYIFPLIIKVEKFPNLYPNASKKEGFYICEDCAVKSLLAYSGCLWYADKINKRFFNIFIYSDEKELLKSFLTKILSDRTIIESGNRSNLSFLNKVEKESVEGLSFQFSCPYEFAFKALYEIVKRLPETGKNMEVFFDTLKVFILRIDNAFQTKSIVNELAVLFIGNKFVEFLNQLMEEEKKWKNFLQQLYFYTRKYETYRKKGKNPQTDLIIRENFFKHVMKKTKVPGELVEELLVYNLSKSDSNDKPKGYEPIFAPLIFKFLTLYYTYGAYMLEEKEILEIAEKEGWLLGKKLLDIEKDTEKVKASIYELRRCRSPTDFMETLNYLQLKADFKFSKDFLNLTREKRSAFKDWKAYFLIGMANSCVEG